MSLRLPVAVVILNWNGLELSRDCLRSWMQARPAPMRILLVDNGSSDASVKVLKKEFPRVEFLALKENLGFAAGNNRGFEHLRRRGAKVKAVFVCNNDTEVRPDMLGRLWETLQQQPAWFAVAPRILFHDSGVIWFEGGHLGAWTGRGIHRHYGRPAGAPTPALAMPKYGFLTGCGVLVRSDALKTLGGFDESFWAYAEDSDLCLRAYAQGWGCGVQPSAAMTHKVSATFGQKSALGVYYENRNSLWLLYRHQLGLWPLTPYLYAGVIWAKRWLWTWLEGRADLRGSLVRALRDGWKGPRLEAEKR